MGTTWKSLVAGALVLALAEAVLSSPSAAKSLGSAGKTASKLIADFMSTDKPGLPPKSATTSTTTTATTTTPAVAATG